MAVITKKSTGKTRTKSAKIILLSLLGLIAIDLIVMLVMFIVAANGGTGTSYGGILGTPFNTCAIILAVLALLLVMVYLLTEPTFKKETVVEENHDLDYRTQYVRKSAHAQPKKVAEVKPEEAPVEEKAE